ncbi:MAG: hypothetical protein HOG95_06585 [Rhodospirillaceae bacterium]|nr:hypothetical protein [Rhodospirillaceae bacterium]MBT5939579.1 hypothetical protein [Rhodospirillaceae bacterium]MBT7267699.1 hypothetical protein [Rhodospirillaceae bacterium]
MLGLFFYSYAAIGLGLLLPAILAPHFLMFGTRLVVGYALLTIYIYAAHVLLRIPLEYTVLSTFLFATIGFLYAFYQNRFRLLIAFILHPTFILLTIGFGSILYNGGIDYIPFTIDEFTNWLGSSREIFLHGDYESVRKTIPHSGYPPGWRLLLILPWQLVGNIEEGLSATAPFVLHVGVVALIFDIAVYLLHTRSSLNNRLISLYAWSFILLLLAAEAMGKLWTYTLLIEQPQIYSASATILFLYLSSLFGAEDKKPRRVAYLYCGLILAASYLIKAAAMLFVPTIVVFAFFPFLNRHFFGDSSWSERLIFCFLTIVPIAFILLTWSMLNPTVSGLGSPIQSLELLSTGNFGNRNIFELSGRFFPAIWDYISTYKLPLTAGTVVAALLIATQRRDGPLLLWFGYFILYTAALLWAHFALWGDLEFGELVSIQRYTRVPIQMLHILGIIFLLELCITLMHRQKRLFQFLNKDLVVYGNVIMIIVLGVWQAGQVHRSVADTSSRIYQNVDPRILEMKSAAKLILALRGKKINLVPKLLVISQPLDHSSRGYALYFSRLKDKTGKVVSAFHTTILSSWPRSPEADYKNPSKIANFRRFIRSADIIWSIKIDKKLSSLVAELNIPRDCVGRLSEMVVLRDLIQRDKYHCIAKPMD